MRKCSVLKRVCQLLAMRLVATRLASGIDLLGLGLKPWWLPSLWVIKKKWIHVCYLFERVQGYVVVCSDIELNLGQCKKCTKIPTYISLQFLFISLQVSAPAPSSPPRSIAQPRPTSNPALVKAPEPAKPPALVDLFSLDAPTPTKSTDLLNSLAQAPVSSQPAKTSLESEVWHRCSFRRLYSC